MTIREPGQASGSAAPATNGSGEGGEQMETDEDFARQLQAKLDAKEARRGCNSLRLLVSHSMQQSMLQKSPSCRTTASSCCAQVHVFMPLCCDAQNCFILLPLTALHCNVNRQNRGGRRPPAAQPYIKVHESEIADDYPMPSQYAAEEDEADELVTAFWT